MKAYHENRMYDSQLPFNSFIVHNFNFLAHWHNDLEFVYVCEGSIRMGINSESRVLHKGDMAICSSGDIHYYDSSNQESTILIIIFSPQLIGCTANWPQEFRLLTPFINGSGVMLEQPAGILPARASELMQQLNRESNESLPHHDMYITGMLYELCGMILRHLQLEPAGLSNDKRRLNNIKMIQQVLDYIESNYSNEITLEDAARLASMSIFHFSRFFKSITGMSFISYLNNIRVNRAEEMILSTNQTIIDIALECGFTNVRTFNRVFKQFRNCAPTSLR